MWNLPDGDLSIFLPRRIWNVVEQSIPIRSRDKKSRQLNELKGEWEE